MSFLQLPCELQERIIKIQSSEGDNFEITPEIRDMCNTVKNLLRGSGKRAFRNSLGGSFRIEDGHVILKKEGRVLASVLREAEDEVVIGLHDVKTSTLKRVMEYCRFHSSVNLSEKEKKSWNTNFVQIEQSALCELASASYYLDIKPLVNLTSRAIATQVSGKSTEEIRETFYNINADLYSSHFSPRYRLQKKVNRKKQELPKAPLQPQEDCRDVDELLSFINNGSTTPQKSQKQKERKKRKRERRREKERELRKQNSEDSDREKTRHVTDDDEEEEEEYKRNGVVLKSQHHDKRKNDSRQASREFLERFTETDPRSEEFEEIFAREDEFLDPEFKARVDREVEEWRKKLEKINNKSNQGPKIKLPIANEIFMAKVVGVR